MRIQAGGKYGGKRGRWKLKRPPTSTFEKHGRKEGGKKCNADILFLQDYNLLKWVQQAEWCLAVCTFNFAKLCNLVVTTVTPTPLTPVCRAHYNAAVAFQQLLQAKRQIARCAAHSLCRYADNMRPFLHIIFLLNCHHCCLVLMHKIFHCRKAGRLDLHLEGGEFQSYIGDVIWSDGACRR